MRTERCESDARASDRTPSPPASSSSAATRSADAATISRRAVPARAERGAARGARRDDQGAGDERSPVAPVDLSQAIIGPGMAIFSKYAAVLEADGTPMSVRTALQLINRFLAEDDFDADTQFCLHWFEQHGWETASSAKPTRWPAPRAPAWTA